MVIRNGETTLLALRKVDAEQVLTASNRVAGLSQKRTPGVMPRICRQTHDELE